MGCATTDTQSDGTQPFWPYTVMPSTSCLAQRWDSLPVASGRACAGQQRTASLAQGKNFERRGEQETDIEMQTNTATKRERQSDREYERETEEERKREMQGGRACTYTGLRAPELSGTVAVTDAFGPGSKSARPCIRGILDPRMHSLLAHP